MKLEPCNSTSYQQIVKPTAVRHEDGPHIPVLYTNRRYVCLHFALRHKYNNGTGNTDLYTHAILHPTSESAKRTHVTYSILQLCGFASRPGLRSLTPVSWSLSLLSWPAACSIKQADFQFCSTCVFPASWRRFFYIKTFDRFV